jgi:hypothetical protein
MMSNKNEERNFSARFIIQIDSSLKKDFHDNQRREIKMCGVLDSVNLSIFHLNVHTACS